MPNLKVIRTPEDLSIITDHISKHDFLAFDTETTGTSYDCKIIGFSVSGDSDEGIYVVLAEWDVEQKKLVDLPTEPFARGVLMGLLGKKLVMHNAIFDCMMIMNNYGIDLMPHVHTDTLILAQLLNENRHNGLKELGVTFFGTSAKAEQDIMKASVQKNGGSLTQKNYELYKAESELIARYGAKDTVLTLNIFYLLVEELYEQGLDKFFYEEESMPLLRGPTYHLNLTGLRVDPERLQQLRAQLQADCLEAKAFIDREVQPLVQEEYPGTKKTNKFNIDSTKQLSWLLFVRLGNLFDRITDEGRAVCHFLGLKLPYTNAAKKEFLEVVRKNKGVAYKPPGINKKTGKPIKASVIKDPWHYLTAGKEVLKIYSDRYKWAAKYLEYKKNMRLLDYYISSINEKMRYNIIRPQFLQHGTTSGRYSSKVPNFQNLPRDDKRIKSLIISRPQCVFVGADYSQLEPRVFASLSGDERLLNCFSSGDDFYSVVGAEVFDKVGMSLKKDEPGSFAKVHSDLRNIAKVITLSATYGTTAPKMAPAIGKSLAEAQEIIDDYFDKFPKVKTFMLDSHNIVKRDGVARSIYGRLRHMPAALNITEIYGTTSHDKLPYEIRNILNLGVNHRVQSTGASIINRAAIAFHKACLCLAMTDHKWHHVKIVLQIHDELVVEGPEELKEEIAIVLKDCMENTVALPGVKLLAEPKIANNLADLK